MVLLTFVTTPRPALLRWSVGLLVGITLLVAPLAGVGAGSGADAGDPVTTLLSSQQDRAVEALTSGSYLEVVGANAYLSLLVQSNQLFLLPWFLGLFLFGFALGRSGLVHELRARRPLLRRAAVLGLGIGLPVNLVMGVAGPLGADPASTAPAMLIARTAVQLLGAPVLTVGYLSTLALAGLRWGPVRSLAATGRMALSVYLLQSLLALVVFWGFGTYDRLSAAEALVVVVGIWVVVVVLSTLWMRAFRFGPVEWVWRTLTYGRGQPLRAGGRDGS